MLCLAKGGRPCAFQQPVPAALAPPDPPERPGPPVAPPAGPPTDLWPCSCSHKPKLSLPAAPGSQTPAGTKWILLASQALMKLISCCETGCQLIIKKRRMKQNKRAQGQSSMRNQAECLSAGKDGRSTSSSLTTDSQVRCASSFHECTGPPFIRSSHSACCSQEL